MTDIIQTTHVISQMPQVMRVRVVRFLLGDSGSAILGAHGGGISRDRAVLRFRRWKTLRVSIGVQRIFYT